MITQELLDTPVKTSKLDDSRYLNIYQEFNKALDENDTDRERENDAWKMYSGFDHGQWDAEAISKLNDEGRHIGQYNFIRNKIDQLAGYFLNNWYDVDYLAIDGKYNDLTVLLKKLYYADKELMNWNESYLLFVIDYLVHSGTEELVVSTKYSPFGNIGFERIMPGHLLVSPDWLSHDGWDLKKAWKVAYLDAKQIKARYNDKSDQIDTAIALLNQAGVTYDNTDTNNGEIPHRQLSNRYGTKYAIIEEHEIVSEKVDIEIVLDMQGCVLQVPQGTDEFKKEWALLNDVDLGGTIINRTINKDKYYRRSICPDLNNAGLLEEVNPIIQIGRLPFFKASSSRINGRDSGLVEILKDTQQTVNKRESLIDAMISNSASGAMVIDPELVGNDFGKMDDLKKNWSNPNFKTFSKPGEIASGRRHVEELPRAQFPQDVISELNRMWDVSDRISKSPAVWGARSEGSEMTGILYARMQRQAEVNSTVQLLGLEAHWNQKGEAYMLVAKDLYAGIYRSFKESSNFKNEGGVIEINKEEVDENGEKKVINDISKLERHKVIVSMSPQGVNYREVERSLNAELLKSIPQTNPISQALAVKNIMKTLPVSTKERQEYEEASEIELKLARSNAEAQIVGLEAQKIQAAMQLQQMMNPQPQQPMGAEGQEAQPAPENPVAQPMPQEQLAQGAEQAPMPPPQA